MNDFSEDSSELPEKSIVQFESKFKPSTKSLHWHYQEGYHETVIIPFS